MLERFTEEPIGASQIKLPQQLLDLDLKLNSVQTFLPDPTQDKIQKIIKILSENKPEFQKLKILFSFEELAALIKDHFLFVLTQSDSLYEVYRNSCEELNILKNRRQTIEVEIDNELEMLGTNYKLNVEQLRKVRRFLYDILKMTLVYYYDRYLQQVATRISDDTRDVRRGKITMYFNTIGRIDVSTEINNIKKPERLEFFAIEDKARSHHYFLEQIQKIYYENNKELVSCLNEAYQDMKTLLPDMDKFIQHLPGWRWDSMDFKPAMKELELSIADFEKNFEKKGVEIHDRWQNEVAESNKKIKDLQESDDIQKLLRYTKRFQEKVDSFIKKLQSELDLAKRIRKTTEDLFKQLEAIQDFILIIKREKDTLSDLLEYDHQKDEDQWEEYTSYPFSIIINNQAILIQHLQAVHAAICDIDKNMKSLQSSSVHNMLSDGVEPLGEKYRTCIIDAINLLNHKSYDRSQFHNAKKEFESYEKRPTHLPLIKNLMDKQALTRRKMQKVKEQRVLRCLELIKSAVSPANSYVWRNAIKVKSYSRINGDQVPGGIQELHNLFNQYQVDSTHDYLLAENIKRIAKRRLDMSAKFCYRFFIHRDVRTQNFYQLLMNLPADLYLLSENQLQVFESQVKKLGLAIASPVNHIELTTFFRH